MKNKLAKKFVDRLVEFPETGMGYHIVDVLFNTGEMRASIKVFNCEDIELSEEETINIKEIWIVGS